MNISRRVAITKRVSSVGLVIEEYELFFINRCEPIKRKFEESETHRVQEKNEVEIQWTNEFTNEVHFTIKLLSKFTFA